MSNDNDHAVVDEFATGFAGEDVLVDPATLKDDDEDLDLAPPLEDQTASNVTPPAGADNPAAAPAGNEPPVVEAPKMRQLTEAEYQDLMNGIADSRKLREETTSRFDSAFAKIGGTERFLQQIQAATPQGEVPEITADSLGEMSKNFPHIVDDLVPALNKVLKSVKGTGAPAVVDPNVISSLVEQGIAKALPSIHQQVQTKVQQDFELGLTVKAHPDAKKVFADPEFSNWVATQPAERQKEILNSWESATMIPVLTEYKAAKAPPAPKPGPQPNARQAAIKAAVNPVSSAPNAPKQLTDDDQFAAGFNETLAATT